MPLTLARLLLVPRPENAVNDQKWSEYIEEIVRKTVEICAAEVDDAGIEAHDDICRERCMRLSDRLRGLLVELQIPNMRCGKPVQDCVLAGQSDVILRVRFDGYILDASMRQDFDPVASPKEASGMRLDDVFSPATGGELLHLVRTTGLSQRCRCQKMQLTVLGTANTYNVAFAPSSPGVVNIHFNRLTNNKVKATESFQMLLASTLSLPWLADILELLVV